MFGYEHVRDSGIINTVLLEECHTVYRKLVAAACDVEFFLSPCKRYGRLYHGERGKLSEANFYTVYKSWGTPGGLTRRETMRRNKHGQRQRLLRP